MALHLLWRMILLVIGVFYFLEAEGMRFTELRVGPRAAYQLHVVPAILRCSASCSTKFGKTATVEREDETIRDT